MSNRRPDLTKLHVDLQLGRATAVLSAVEALESEGPLADEALRLKMAALEAPGYHGEALEAALQLRDQRPQTVMRLLAKMEDVVVTDELESVLCDLLQAEEFFHPRVYAVLVDRLGEKLRAQGPATLHALSADRFLCLALAKLELWWPDIERSLTTLRSRNVHPVCPVRRAGLGRERVRPLCPGQRRCRRLVAATSSSVKASVTATIARKPRPSSFPNMASGRMASGTWSTS